MTTLAAAELPGYTEMSLRKSVKLRLEYIALHRGKTLSAALAEIVEREFRSIQEDRRGETGKV